MKRLVPALLALLGLAGCDASPASLGITGPAPLVQPAAPDDSTIGNPGLPSSPTGYGPTIGPSRSGNGQDFNYN